MAKFQFGPYEDINAVMTARVGSGATAGTRLTDADIGKWVKFSAASRYDLCDQGDLIEGQLMSIESATQDGYAIGGINTGGYSRLSALCDGLQATAGIGTIALGDYVVCGTVVAAQTATTALTGLKVCTATAQSAITGEVGVMTLAFPVNLVDITTTMDVVTAFTPGYNFEILKLDFMVNTPASTTSKLLTLNAEIGTTNVTGGAVALTTAACTPYGKIIAGSAITALNTGAPTDTISIEAASVTAFSEGTGTILLTIQNTDMAAVAAASIVTSNLTGRWRVIALGNAGAVGDTCIITRR